MGTSTANNVAAVQEMHELLVLSVHFRGLHIFGAHAADAMPAELLDELLGLLQCGIQHFGEVSARLFRSAARTTKGVADSSERVLLLTEVFDATCERDLGQVAVVVRSGKKPSMTSRSAREVGLREFTGRHGQERAAS